MKKIISACGNDCGACPRHLPKNGEQLGKTAELWYNIGYRDKIVSSEEISCTGCKPNNWCRYSIVGCAAEKGVENCGRCSEYPCGKITDCFSATMKFAPKCRECCTDNEYDVMCKAFFEKKPNLDREQKRSAPMGKWAEIGIFAAETALLYAVLYFTFVLPIAPLIVMAYVCMPLYAALYIALFLLLSQFPRKSTGGFFVRHIRKPILLAAAVGVCFLAVYFGGELGRKVRTAEINAFAAASEEQIRYENAYYTMDGLNGTAFIEDTIFIDYDTKEVGFLSHNCGFYRFRLTENTDLGGDCVQAVIPLTAPGESLTTYYPSRELWQYTSAVMLKMADGTFYSFSNIHDGGSDFVFMSLNQSKYFVGDEGE